MQDGYLLIKDLLYHAFVNIILVHVKYIRGAVFALDENWIRHLYLEHISLIVKVLNLESKVAVVSKFLQIIFNWI